MVDKLTNGLAGKEVQVGYFEGINYEDGTPVAYVATIQEFGAPSQNIPPRPTMGPTVIENQDHYTKQLGAAAKVVMDGKMNGGDALQLIGDEVAGDIREHISKLTSPALAKGTILARAVGAKHGEINSPTIAKPLIDTGQMLNSVQSAVVEK